MIVRIFNIGFDENGNKLCNVEYHDGSIAHGVFYNSISNEDLIIPENEPLEKMQTFRSIPTPRSKSKPYNRWIKLR